MVRTRLKMAATLTVVVLALTGFQTGHGSSSGGGSGKSKSGKSRSDSDDDSGGGCSSDEKSNDDYSGSDGSGGSGGSEVTPSPTSETVKIEVVVVDCVKSAQKKRKGKPARKADTTATLKAVSRDELPGTYWVTLHFRNASGTVQSIGEIGVTVGSHETKTFEVKMENPQFVDRVTNCWVYEVRRHYTTALPTESGTPSPSP
ncbi:MULTISPECIES: hypothetical protein [Streptomyces]|uniref:Uncharacterized protein n=1 Tax=Streptomyces venezuelae TaxID=54571 RepID=A0A5P2ATY1_STRVZ|nr:hypothetical protein [Streptomyces venezuelae]QES21605.1 hypothetical protein DEJ46_22920 [Streptomyces venezuelae]